MNGKINNVSANEMNGTSENMKSEDTELSGKFVWNSKVNQIAQLIDIIAMRS